VDSKSSDDSVVVYHYAKWVMLEFVERDRERRQSLAVHDAIGIVVIGRNEGTRLVRCLASLPVGVPCVYVDSESSDDSVAVAEKAGADVVRLTAPPKHSAARARNAGIDWLRENHPEVRYVMLLDGDCTLSSGWLTEAADTLSRDCSVALVFGRLRERFPQRSIFNALCDDEWNHPVGEAYQAGGIFCSRIDALTQANGFREEMIAGEDPELAVRLRLAGWQLCCVDAEMAVHDANILHFSQWWRRARRSGHAFTELARLHPTLTKPNWRAQCRSIAFWGAAFPSFVLLSGCLAMAVRGEWLIVTIALFGLWSAQWLRLTLKRSDLQPKVARANAFFLLVGKIAEFTGMVEFHRKRLLGSETQLIEYKGAPQ
jgi:GT2 family glycosyltransferase